MMKMNLIAGVVCLALLSACSSQRITAGNENQNNSSATTQSTSTTAPRVNAQDVIKTTETTGTFTR